LPRPLHSRPGLDQFAHQWRYSGRPLRVHVTQNHARNGVSDRLDIEIGIPLDETHQNNALEQRIALQAVLGAASFFATVDDRVHTPCHAFRLEHL